MKGLFWYLKSILFHLPPLLYSQVRTIFSLDCSFRWLSKFKTFFHCWSSPRICTVCVSPFVQRTIGRYYRRQKRETNQRASGSGATDGPPFQIFVSTSRRVWVIMRDSSILLRTDNLSCLFERYSVCLLWKGKSCMGRPTIIYRVIVIFIIFNYIQILLSWYFEIIIAMIYDSIWWIFDFNMQTLFSDIVI